MRPFLLAFAIGALALGATVPQAAACSCLQRTPSDYLTSADAAFLGVAGPEVVKGGRSSQTFTILHALKGKLGRSFALKRPAGLTSGCDASFPKGGISLVFVNKGQTSTCDGNYALDFQLGWPNFEALILRSGAKSESPPIEAFGRAFEEMLTPYLGGRAKIQVDYAPLAGREVKVGPTIFTFSKGIKEAGVNFTHTVSRGTLHYLRGTLEPEHIAFTVLLDQAPGQYHNLLGRFLSDPAGVPAPYRCAADSDCTSTCAAGAVNAAWLRAHAEKLTDCDDGCTSKGAELGRCIAGTCTSFFQGRREPACTMKPIPWR